MNKTININLAGIIFHLDEEAYNKLTAYLQSIKDRLKGDPGQEEIIADIEARVAELFTDRLGKVKEVISMTDVEDVMSILGSPEDYQSDEDAESESFSESTYTHNQTYSFGKKLFRNTDDKVLGGVASGLGAYLGIDRVWIRLIWACLFFFWGAGLLIYIILWIVVPEAITTAQKLQMKGEPINVSNIERSVKNVGDKVERMANDPNLGHRIGNFVDQIVKLLSKLLKFILKIAMKLFGIILLILGILLIVATFGTLLGHDIFVVDNMFGMHDISGYVDRILVNPGQHGLFVLGIVLMAIGPIVWFLAAGSKILFDYKTNTRIPLVASSLVSIAGVVLVAFIVKDIKQEIRSTSKISKIETLDITNGNKYFLTVNDLRPYESDEIAEEIDWTIEDDANYLNKVSLNVKKSDKGDVFLKLSYSAHGKTVKDAKERAKSIMYHYEQTDSMILFNDFIKLKENEKFRIQKLHITMYLPVGTSIYLSDDMESIIYDIDNVTDTRDSRMLGHTWLMTQNGLVCTDCIGDDFESEDTEVFEEEWETEANEIDEQRKQLQIEKEKLEKAKELERLEAEINKLQKEREEIEKSREKNKGTSQKTKYTHNSGFHAPLYILPVNSPLNVEHNQSYVTQV